MFEANSDDYYADRTPYRDVESLIDIRRPVPVVLDRCTKEQLGHLEEALEYHGWAYGTARGWGVVSVEDVEVVELHWDATCDWRSHYRLNVDGVELSDEEVELLAKHAVESVEVDE